MKTDTFVKPLSDLCFKYIFSHEIILKDFIDAFLEYINEEARFQFTYVKAEDSMNPKNKDEKTYFGDLVASTNTDFIIDLEAYTTFKISQFRKSLAYAVRLYNENVLNTNDYKSRPIISINLMTGNYRRMNKDIVNKYRLSNTLLGKEITDNLTLYLIRIDIACKKSYNEGEKRFITWLRFVNSKSIEEIEELVKLMKGDRIMTQTMKFVKDWNKRSAVNGFERILEEKYYFGYDDGETKGIKIGKTEGILETARNMLKNSFSVEDVKKATNLSKKEILSIQKELQLES